MKPPFVKLASLSLSLGLAATSAKANPVNKLCRASSQVQAMHETYEREKPAKIKGLCFHAGRMVGAIEEGMTFRDRARQKTPPHLLALADRIVAQAAALASDCNDESDDNRATALTAKISDLATLNAEINTKSCAEE